MICSKVQMPFRSCPAELTAHARPIVRTSAKTGSGIVETFHDAAETIVRRGLL